MRDPEWLKGGLSHRKSSSSCEGGLGNLLQRSYLQHVALLLELCLDLLVPRAVHDHSPCLGCCRPSNISLFLRVIAAVVGPLLVAAFKFLLSVNQLVQRFEVHVRLAFEDLFVLGPSCPVLLPASFPLADTNSQMRRLCFPVTEALELERPSQSFHCAM